MNPVSQSDPRIGGDTVTRIELGRHGLRPFLDVVKELPGRLYYCEGSLTIVSPSHPHERDNDHLDEIIKAICDELDIDYSPAASTLFLRDDLDRGVEPDKSYYIAHQGAIDENEDEGVDLRHYPPPDLVVEVIWSHPDIGKIEILKAMGVPELWRYTIRKGEVLFLHLDEGGEYVPRTRSRSFPFLSPEDVLGQLRSVVPGEPHNRWKRRLRAWVRETLGPRRAGEAGDGR